MADINEIEKTHQRIHKILNYIPLQRSPRLSEKYNAEIYFKREDLQTVRSFKIRGAYNAIVQLDQNKIQNGVVCASAGNHAQGVAYSCATLKIKGYIFMPTVTPNQKVDKVKYFGKDFVEVILTGDTFDDAYSASMEFCEKHKATYIHPFNNQMVIEGQGTIGYEIYKELQGKIDYVLLPVGGGGLGAGVSSYIKGKNPNINIIGIEASGGASMKLALENAGPTMLSTIDTFVDGTAVKTVGDLTYEIFKKYVDRVLDVPEGLVCRNIIELYQKDGIITEPAGALSVSGLDEIKDEIKGKTVICIISGGNNDLQRYPEIVERALIFEGLKHYFIINFKQKPGELKKLLMSAIGPSDDIVRFEYTKKTNAEMGPAFVGIELKNKADYSTLVDRMKEQGIEFKEISDKEMLYKYLV